MAAARPLAWRLLHPLCMHGLVVLAPGGAAGTVTAQPAPSPRPAECVVLARVPVGTRLSSKNGLTRVPVLRSGPPASRDAWVEERVNALEDWRTLFERLPERLTETSPPAGA